MKPTITVIHRIAAMLAFLMIFSFFTSTVVVELFGDHQDVYQVKTVISYAIWLLIPMMAITGFTGAKMGGKSSYPPILAKKKRMPFIAINGLLILTPCAFYLQYLAEQSQFNDIFYVVQGLELMAGMINLTLMSLNIRDGLAMSKRRKSSSNRTIKS
ncbi:hypothetical protein L4C54_06970 [Vibrio lamellibrachiae]|uniref:hypothetical protein n=1 Tax=Vibrio lamellibrachiae TaxID=2910253 RepID=UPI003D0B7F5D